MALHANRMTARPQAGAKRPDPRLYLVTPVMEETEGLVPVLTEMLAAGDIAAVLLRLADADERTLVKRIKILAPVVQNQGAALIIADRPEIVARAGADGAHLTGADALTDAIGSLKPDRIAGAGGLVTRHDAMTAAEVGADYVMFGEPIDDRRAGFDEILERVEWWAEVFQVPCAGFAGSLDEVQELVGAGTDFVALGEFAFAGGAAMIQAAAERLIVREPVP
jgi:thiamine-phosphate pyrophosphorylase